MFQLVTFQKPGHKLIWHLVTLTCLESAEAEVTAAMRWLWFDRWFDEDDAEPEDTAEPEEALCGQEGKGV